jgi:hypothetical protein
MNDSQIIAATVFRDTLMTIPEIIPLVDMAGQSKIFWEHVDEDVPLPYIVTSYLYGQEDLKYYPSRAEDSVWKIVGVTNNMVTAVALANAIGKLHKKEPVVNDPDACGYGHIWKVSSYFERQNLQNVALFIVGGYYSLGLSLRSS